MSTIKRSQRLEAALKKMSKDVYYLTTERAYLVESLREQSEHLRESTEQQVSLTEKIDGLAAEKCRLEGELKGKNDALEAAQDNIVALEKRLEKLAIWNAQQGMKLLRTEKALTEMSERTKKLAEENTILKRQAMDADSMYPKMGTLVTASKRHKIIALYLQLKQEIAKANAQIDDASNAGSCFRSPSISFQLTLRQSSTSEDLLDDIEGANLVDDGDEEEEEKMDRYSEVEQKENDSPNQEYIRFIPSANLCKDRAPSEDFDAEVSESEEECLYLAAISNSSAET